MTHNTHVCTYTFADGSRERTRALIDRIDETVETLRARGEAIEFLGATQSVDSDGAIVEMTAQFRAPSKGTVGYLNVEASLPASGQPRVV
jgi:hypothetical protein